MVLSQETHAVMAYFDQYTEFSVRKRNDLAAMLDIAMLHDEAELWNTTVFTGKVVWSLYMKLRELQGSATAEESYRRIEQEFAAVVNQLREHIVYFAHLSDNQAFQERLKETYLHIHQGTIRNIVDLAHDLARFKDMQHDEQRRSRKRSIKPDTDA
ncbi:MAG: hypothetical protein RML40_06585 [Bacteroidota bacterium]|nr:hypothetical protein [Candidatus Kapabacteria bacterium]MDW8220183.1 hypothetical protein [Bacteroidota bacterium]